MAVTYMVWLENCHWLLQTYRTSRESAVLAYGEGRTNDRSNILPGEVKAVCARRFGSDHVYTYRVDRTRLRTVVTLIAEARL